jgi:hypothetical protein
MRQGSQEVGAFQKGVSSLRGELGALAATAGAGIGLAALVGEALRFADSVQKVHDQTGLAIDTIQFLRVAADQTGGSVDNLASLVTKMQRQIVDAGSNDKLKQQLADIGVEVEKIRYLRPEEQFRIMSRAVAEVPDEAGRAAAAVAAFGKSGADAIPTLTALTERSGEI